MKNLMHTTAALPPASPRSPLRVLIGGILGLMVAMGIGRLAFTPILPLMQRELGVSHSLAGFLADRQSGFALPLLLVGIVVASGALLTATDSHFSRK